MSSIAIQENVHLFIGYFEEPEPGVPAGYTGWYHSGGKFPIESAEQVFAVGEQSRSVIRDEVFGPFTCRDDAMLDLQESLTC